MEPPGTNFYMDDVNHVHTWSSPVVAMVVLQGNAVENGETNNHIVGTKQDHFPIMGNVSTNSYPLTTS